MLFKNNKLCYFMSMNKQEGCIMLKELDPQIVEKTIKAIIDNSYGIKLNDLMITLCHSLLNDGFEVNGDEIQNLIYRMIAVNSICEITYVIGKTHGRTRSFLLPARTEISGNTILAEPKMGTAHIAPVTLPRPGSPTDKVGHTAPTTT